MRVRDWSRPARQSPVTMLIGLLKGFRETGPVLILLIAAYLFRDADTEGKTKRPIYTVVGIMIGGVLVSLNKIIGYFFTRFWIEGETLIVTRGIISRHRTEIPFANITGLHRSQQWIHRISSTCRITIETAGSETSEWVADAITLADADALQQYLRNTGMATSLMQEHSKKDHVTFRYNTSDVLKLALTENHLQSFIIIILFIIGRMQDIREYLGFDSFNYMEQQGGKMVATAQMLSGLMLTGLFISMIVSTLRVLLKYAQFSIVNHSGVYILSRGLLHTVRKAMPLDKVEYITWKSNLLRSRLNLYLLRMHALAESDTEVENHMQMPVPNKTMLHSLLQAYTNKRPGLDAKAVCKRVSVVYVYRALFLYMIPAGIISGSVLGWKFGWLGSLVIVPLLYGLLHRLIWQQRFRLFISGNVLEIKRGVWGTEQLLIEIPRIVSVSLRSSPWQRRNGYANLVLHLPGSRWEIPFLSRKEAEELLNYLSARIEIAGVSQNKMWQHDKQLRSSR